MKSFTLHEIIAPSHRMGWAWSSSCSAVEDSEVGGARRLLRQAVEARALPLHPLCFASHLLPRCLWSCFTFTISETLRNFVLMTHFSNQCPST